MPRRRTKKNLILSFIITSSLVYLISLFTTFVLQKWERAKSDINPIHIFFSEFDFTDLYYKTRYFKIPAHPFKDILIIDGYGCGREKLAEIVDAVNSFEPDVVGLDYIFDPASVPDSSGTGKLQATLKKYHNVITGAFLDETGLTYSNDPRHKTQKSLNIGENHIGFLNISNYKTTIRQTKLNDSAKRGNYPSFALAIAQQEIGQDDPYLRKYEESNSFVRFKYLPKTAFETISADNLLAHPRDYAARIKGAVVMVGDVNMYALATEKTDMHFTPLNTQVAGRSLPDMEGIYIHANIVSSLMRGEMVNEVSESLITAITFLFSLPFVFLTLYLYCKPKSLLHEFFTLIYEFPLFCIYVSLFVVLFHYKVYISFETPFLLLAVVPVVIKVMEKLDKGLNNFLKTKYNKKGTSSYFAITHPEK